MAAPAVGQSAISTLLLQSSTKNVSAMCMSLAADGSFCVAGGRQCKQAILDDFTTLFVARNHCFSAKNPHDTRQVQQDHS
jgi:hypothetical protein